MRVSLDNLNGAGYNSAPVPPRLPPDWRVEVATGAHIAQAERLEYEVFVEIGYCERSDLGRSMEYEPWREQSAFQVVIDDADQVAATVRTLVGPFESLPVGKFERELALPPDPVIEFASLAVPSSRRQRGLTEALFQAVFRDAMRWGVGGLVAIGEKWLVDVLNGTYGYGFRQLGPSRWYMGGDCFPMGVELHDLVTRLVEHQPRMLAFLTEEIDLREVRRQELRPSIASAHELEGS